MRELYFMSVGIMAVSVATMALVLMMFKSVSFQEDRDLANSRKYLVICLLAMVLNCVLHFNYGYRINRPSVGIALDITTYFFVGLHLSYVYIPILDHTYRNKKSSKHVHIIAWTATTACLWVAALFTYGIPSKILLTIGGIMCALSFSRLLIDFVKSYRAVSDIITDESFINVESFSRFIFNSVILMGVTGLASMVVWVIGDIDLQSYVTLASTISFFYLSMSFVNYVISLK